MSNLILINHNEVRTGREYRQQSSLSSGLWKDMHQLPKILQVEMLSVDP